MKTLLISLVLMTSAVPSLPVKALTKAEQLTEASVNLGWMQATCYYYSVGAISSIGARDTLRQLKKDMVSKSMGEIFTESKESTLASLPECKGIFESLAK